MIGERLHWMAPCILSLDGRTSMSFSRQSCLAPVYSFFAYHDFPAQAGKSRPEKHEATHVAASLGPPHGFIIFDTERLAMSQKPCIDPHRHQELKDDLLKVMAAVGCWPWHAMLHLQVRVGP